jgi:hypothetical protein
MVAILCLACLSDLNHKYATVQRGLSGMNAEPPLLVGSMEPRGILP